MLTVNFKHLAIKAGDTVLDLGCGEGRHVISLACEPGVNAVGIDLGYGDLSTAKSRMEDCAAFKSDSSTFLIAQANGLVLPFADNSFDKVICSEVLEHIPDWHGVVAEIHRVLKPGGLFAVSVPRQVPEQVCWWLSDAYHEVEGGHIRIFRSKVLKNSIINYGFDFLYRHWAHALHVPYWWLKCLFWKRGDNNLLVKAYHRMLVWDMMKKPAITQVSEQILNPIMGKSVVMYFRKRADY